MAQYIEITLGNPHELTNNISTFRYNVSGGILYLDQEITALGFSGVENTDWASIENHTGGGTGVFRLGVRSAHWNVDEELDGTGFTGVENVNWINIEKHKLS